MSWTQPQFSRGKVDAAGRLLAHSPVWLDAIDDDDVDIDAQSLEDALAIINNWRSSHSYPLQIIKMTLLSRARKIDKRALIAQRLKRLSSIDIKLRNNPNMKLTQMQDIGGCRAVVSTPAQITRVVDVYKESIAKSPRNRPECIEEYDYIQHPKADGYRSHHFVYKYRTASPALKVYEGLRIEVQIRSRLQHAWATAVETASTFTGQALKSNVGEPDWKRFFSLMGSALAIRERLPIVPGTPRNKGRLMGELKGLSNKLCIKEVLAGWSSAVSMLEDEAMATGTYAFLLVFDSAKKTLRVRGFNKSETTRADEEYLTVEKASASNPNVQAVLVSVESVAALRSTYPNYYADTTAFLEALDRAVTS